MKNRFFGIIILICILIVVSVPVIAQDVATPETVTSGIVAEDNPLAPYFDLLVTMLGSSMGFVWVLTSATKYLFKTVKTNLVVSGWTLALGVVYLGSYYMGITDENWQSSLQTITEIGLGLLTLGGIPVLTGALYRSANTSNIPVFGYKSSGEDSPVLPFEK